MAPGASDPPHRTLKVKCATWDQVEAFYARKVHSDGRLPMRVPFAAHVGDRVSLALQLPGGLVVSIDGDVIEAEPAADGKRSAMVLAVHGMTAELRQRLAALVEDGRAGGQSSGELVPPPSDEPPAAQPADVPVDERVPPPSPIEAEAVSPEERGVFAALETDLRDVREGAAHEVLGVAWDAGVADVRGAYFGLTKRYHPDIYARYRSRPILDMAQEIFILVNRAYDRMRDAAVEAGAGIVAGPALLPHSGWLVADFADLGEQADKPKPAPLPAKRSRAESSPGILTGLFAEAAGTDPDAAADPGAQAIDSDDDVLDQARALLAAEEHDNARSLLAGALKRSPRNRSLRALYYVAFGRKLMAEGDGVKAIAQFEAAIAHDRSCAEARASIDAARGEPAKKTGLFKRLFR